MDNTTKPFVIFGQPGGHPQYEENSNRLHKGHNVGREECCVYCGKHCLSAKYFVFLDSGCNAIESRDMDEHMDDLGFYPIGSECRKTALAASVPVYDANYTRIDK